MCKNNKKIMEFYKKHKGSINRLKRSFCWGETYEVKDLLDEKTLIVIANWLYPRKEHKLNFYCYLRGAYRHCILDYIRRKKRKGIQISFDEFKGT